MNLYILEIQFNFSGKEEALYPVILQDGQETILVDCGYAGFMPLIEKSAWQHGISLEQLTGILITHHDMDHMGGLAELKARYPLVKIYSSDIEETYISGKSKSLRLLQAEALHPTLPEEQKPGALYFQEILKNVQPVEVDHTVAPGQVPAFMPDIQIISTPGHMPGHISIYLPTQKTSIAADALVYQEGELDIANPAFALDLPEAIASVKKLQLLEIYTLVCYHGGLVEENIQEKLSKLIHRYTRQ